MFALRVANSKKPKRCFGHCCGSRRATGSDTSMTVLHKLNVRIPSIRRPASNEIISASVLLCDTAVCFLYDDEIGTNVELPNKHNNPPHVDLESAMSPVKSAS